MITEKTCKGPCGRKLDIDEFHWKSKRRGTRQPKCKDCMKTYSAEHYKSHSQEYKDRANNRLKSLRTENRALVQSWISSHPCQKCGETNSKVLSVNIGSIEINNKSTSDLQTLLDQSAVLCRNCQASQD